MSSSSSSDFHDTAAMSWKEYMDFLELPYEEIKSATNNFSDANLIAQGSTFNVYKAQLLISDGQFINIVARRTPQLHVFVNELSLYQYLNHKNISSIFKFAYVGGDDDDDDDESVILINKHEANGSLDKHLRGSTLTWMQRLKICLEVAHALCYIHNHNLGDDHYFIHGNIKSSKILLNHNWEPMLHGFGFAREVKKNHGYFTGKHNATVQYMDPAYETTNTLTYKSDVFSFGVVLFEVLFGTKAFIQNGDNWYFARLARLHYQETTLDHMIHPDLHKQMDLQSLKIFSEVAYCCLKEQRGERPNMDQIVIRLKKALELQQEHQTPKEHLTPTIGATSSTYLEGKNHLKIRLSDIELATNKFSIANYIGHGGYGRVYKAVLDHFDSTTSSATEGNNKGDFSKRRSTVAIKRLFSRQDGQEEQGFSTEIETLANCKHPNIVSLLGFCEEGLEWILIYEYVTNGSLSDYLGNVNNMTNLTWSQRIQICLDIAHGLNYLHTSTQKKPMIIHRDIKSGNILLDDNWVAKIADFGLSKLLPADLKASTINTDNIAGTEVYLDPEYIKTGKLKKESDIYSFGVVLFEILCGRLAYDEYYNFENEKGLSSTVRRCFSEGTLKDLVDPKLKETHENIFGLNGGLNQDSLDTFMNIAYQCLANTQTDRPTTKVIIEELEKALDFQKNSKDNLQISLRDIKLATQNFSDDMCTGEGRYWKQYGGEITHANVCTTIVAKRFDSKSIQGHHQFVVELNALSEYKHENIVALVGYCNELDENVIEFEHATNGSLDKNLDNGSLSWMKRLKICIDIASGLEFLHTEMVTHHDIKSASILIDGDWKAKISNLELVSKYLESDEKIEHVTSSLSYVDPMYKRYGYLTRSSDIYSLGVVLIEILSGRLASSFEESSGDLVQKCKESAEALDKLVFEDIKKHCASQSLTTFFELATECLDLENTNRPDARQVVIKLKKALELQEDYEIWEPKLPKDYEQIILMSNTPEIYSNETKKDLYEMLTKGILLQQGKLWFVLGGNGENNEMISATKFSYKNCPYRWRRSLPESRFRKVAEMLDISNLMIKIMTRPQFLTPNVVYGVHLVFKFCDSRNFSSKPMYVNLKYKKGNETLHTYFATSRDDEWMMIELYRFLNLSEDVVFKFLLESLSLYNCGDDSIYVEGIEFRAIDNVEQKDQELKEEEQVLKLTSNVVQVQQMPIKSEDIFKRSQNYDDGEKMFLSEVNRKKHLVFSAKGSLYDFSDLKRFNSKPSAESRFQEVIELLPQPVFRINCTIKSQMLSQDTHAYACYLVFKLSEKCQGLRCPVEVRDLLHREKKDAEIIYFKSPSPWNIHDITRVPTPREDGWMEVQVWKINNSQNEVKNSCIPIKLKFLSYEGTISGLIVCGLEFRSM